MRALLRRRLQETVAHIWQDTDLDTLLALGLQEMQKKILAIDPDAFKYIDRADITKDLEFYEQPAGAITIYDVRVKSDATALYESLGDPLPRHEAIGNTNDTQRWFRWDRYIGLSPIPSANKVQGLECEWGPTLAMSADSDVPTIKLPLHMGIVIWAEKFAIGDTGESSDGVDKDLAPYINAIPQMYQPHAAPGRFTVDLVREGAL